MPVKRTSRRVNQPGIHRDVRVDRPAGPVVPAEPHPMDRRLVAEQAAVNDHAANTFDLAYVSQLDGQLPHDRDVDSETDRIQSDARQRKLDGFLAGWALLQSAVATGVAGRGVHHLRAELAGLLHRAGELETARQEHVDVLQGRREDGSGRNRTGPVPSSRHYWWWLVRAHALTGLLIVLDLVALYAVFGYVFAVDNPSDLIAHPELAATALLGAVMVFAPPVALGMLLRGSYRNHQPRPLHNAGVVLMFLVLLGLWIGAVSLMAEARGAAFAAPTEAVLGGQVDNSVNQAGLVWLLFLVFTLLGVFTMWHQSRHNWHGSEVVRLQAEMNRVGREVAQIRSELDRTTALISTQQQVLEIDLRSWDQHIDGTLPALGEEIKGCYRAELRRRMADPAVTGALDLNRTERHVSTQVDHTTGLVRHDHSAELLALPSGSRR